MPQTSHAPSLNATPAPFSCTICCSASCFCPVLPACCDALLSAPCHICCCAACPLPRLPQTPQPTGWLPLSYTKRSKHWLKSGADTTSPLRAQFPQELIDFHTNVPCICPSGSSWSCSDLARCAAVLGTHQDTAPGSKKLRGNVRQSLFICIDFTCRQRLLSSISLCCICF